MSTELTTVTPMELISQELTKGTSVADLTQLFNLQERYEKQEAAKKFALSITGFQSVCPAVEKTKPVTNKGGAIMYYFADYADLLKVVQPYLTQFEIVPTFSFPVIDGTKMVLCRIRVGTHVEETCIPMAVPDILNTNECQRLGGMTSFGMRYALRAALNIRIIGEDMDATDQDDTLTKEEVKILQDLIDELNFIRTVPFPVPAMCHWLREGATKLSEIPRSQFVNALADVKSKRIEAEQLALKKGRK